MSFKNILIRSDGSNDIGLGHITRCLTFANYLKKKKINSTFVTSTNEISEVVLNSGFNCIFLERDDEIRHLQRISLSLNTNIIIIDTDYNRVFPSKEAYYIHVDKLRDESFFIVSFDDMWSANVNSNIVVIPYLGAEKIKIRNTSSRHLLGEKYFLLRNEFLCKPNFIVRRKIKRILITMGGSDPEKITLRAIKSIRDTNLKVKVTVLIGKFSKITRREIFALSNGNLNILHNTSNISELMLNCDIAITNSGLTKYELSALGVPYIVISDNLYQKTLMEDFSKKCVSIHVGMFSNITTKKLSQSIVNLSTNYSKRVELSTNGKRFIDGHGIDRLYSEIF
ncbi:hypothetical protein HOL24_07555 [bacterium]|jgi:spore coat polysaccharide biosynthesis predicted glycosyltransferase SpsG|nr:hypothetical protein [bacterium]